MDVLSPHPYLIASCDSCARPCSFHLFTEVTNTNGTADSMLVSYVVVYIIIRCIALYKALYWFFKR
jgi:hypothetical protein